MADDDYEIYTDYPYQIRRKSTNRIIKETINKEGYVRCCLNKRIYRKHRIIAEQWIENPDPENFTMIDHINQNKIDNRIENLRWCDNSINQRNCASHQGYECEYLDEIPLDSLPLDFYNDHDFEFYSIDTEDNVYIHNGIRFRKLLKHDRYGTGNYFVCMRDIHGRKVKVYLRRWHNQ